MKNTFTPPLDDLLPGEFEAIGIIVVAELRAHLTSATLRYS